MADKSKIKTAITPTRTEDYPEWYQQVIRAADLGPIFSKLPKTDGYLQHSHLSFSIPDLKKTDI